MSACFDVAVIGGGLTGLCAALASARGGAKTALVQDRPVLGGNSSSEIGVGPDSAVKYNAFMMETGLIEELLLYDRAHNHGELSDAGRANSLYDLHLYDFAVRQEGLTLFLNARVTSAALRPDGGIASVSAVRAGNQPPLTIEAAQFCDCTGDGALAAMAGASFSYGREARGEYGENLAPIQADDITMGATIALMARDVGRAVSYQAPDWAKRFDSEQSIGIKRSVGVPARASWMDGFWWMEMGAPLHQIDDYDALRHELLRHVLGVWDYIKNRAPDRENAASLGLEWIGALPGKRESRRVTGLVTLTENDIRQHRHWPDAVATGGWFLDEHIPGGILNPSEPPDLAHVDDNYKHYAQVTPYAIPLRALISRDVPNLWMAGRDMSVSHIALCSVRIQNTLAVTGEAVGTAAAYAREHGIAPRETAETPHILQIQQTLLRNDVRIIGLSDAPTRDVAASATSQSPLDFGAPSDRFEPLDRQRGLVFPVTSGRVEAVTVRLRNENDCAVRLQAVLHMLHDIWDEEDGVHCAQTEVEVPPHFQGDVVARFNADVRPHTPYRFSLKSSGGIGWARATLQPVGTLAQYLYTCPGGAEPRNRDMPSLKESAKLIPQFAAWMQPARDSHAFYARITPCPMPYPPEAVLDGHHHPCEVPHLWAADPNAQGVQSLTLTLSEPHYVRCVRVVFDTDLNCSHGRQRGLWRASTCADEALLYALTGENWVLVHHMKGNFRRVRDFPVSDTVHALRLDFPDAACARVYNIALLA